MVWKQFEQSFSMKIVSTIKKNQKEKVLMKKMYSRVEEKEEEEE